MRASSWKPNSAAAAPSALSFRAATTRRELRARGTSRLFFRRTNHASIQKQRAQIFHPSAVNAEVAIADPRGGTHGDEILRRARVQLQIVDESENCAAALGLEVNARFADDFGSRQRADDLAHSRPRVGQRQRELKCRDKMLRVRCVARHAGVRRAAWRETPVFDSEIMRARAGAGKKPHEDEDGENDLQSRNRSRVRTTTLYSFFASAC